MKNNDYEMILNLSVEKEIDKMPPRSLVFNHDLNDSPIFYAMPTFNVKIKKVIFNNPATIVYWNDGTKTVVKCSDNDKYDPEKGLALCMAKKLMGNKGSYYNEFKKWIHKKNEDNNQGNLFPTVDEIVNNIQKGMKQTTNFIVNGLKMKQIIHKNNITTKIEQDVIE